MYDLAVIWDWVGFSVRWGLPRSEISGCPAQHARAPDLAQMAELYHLGVGGGVVDDRLLGWRRVVLAGSNQSGVVIVAGDRDFGGVADHRLAGL